MYHSLADACHFLLSDLDAGLSMTVVAMVTGMTGDPRVPRAWLGGSHAVHSKVRKKLLDDRRLGRVGHGKGGGSVDSSSFLTSLPPPRFGRRSELLVTTKSTCVSRVPARRGCYRRRGHSGESDFKQLLHFFASTLGCVCACVRACVCVYVGGCVCVCVCVCVC
jgi:hypothetical protein